MATLRERIEAETANSRSDSSSNWLDPEIGQFVCREVPELKEYGCAFRSEAIFKKYPNDADLEAAYARWLIEKGD